MERGRIFAFSRRSLKTQRGARSKTGNSSAIQRIAERFRVICRRSQLWATADRLLISWFPLHPCVRWRSPRMSPLVSRRISARRLMCLAPLLSLSRKTSLMGPVPIPTMTPASVPTTFSSRPRTGQRICLLWRRNRSPWMQSARRRRVAMWSPSHKATQIDHYCSTFRTSHGLFPGPRCPTHWMIPKIPRSPFAIGWLKRSLSLLRVRGAPRPFSRPLPSRLPLHLRLRSRWARSTGRAMDKLFGFSDARSMAESRALATSWRGRWTFLSRCCAT
mmetsp:Transcript_53850/g.108025  ORF Transcript_53850/g.108025 Transcript_53850/m.108025 type:complete len:275 (+) Transcript_53850:274-1098(+)